MLVENWKILNDFNVFFESIVEKVRVFDKEEFCLIILINFFRIN